MRVAVAAQATTIANTQAALRIAEELATEHTYDHYKKSFTNFPGEAALICRPTAANTAGL